MAFEVRVDLMFDALPLHLPGNAFLSQVTQVDAIQPSDYLTAFRLTEFARDDTKLPFTGETADCSSEGSCFHGNVV